MYKLSSANKWTGRLEVVTTHLSNSIVNSMEGEREFNFATKEWMVQCLVWKTAETSSVYLNHTRMMQLVTQFHLKATHEMLSYEGRQNAYSCFFLPVQKDYGSLVYNVIAKVIRFHGMHFNDCNIWYAGSHKTQKTFNHMKCMHN